MNIFVILGVRESLVNMKPEIKTIREKVSGLNQRKILNCSVSINTNRSSLEKWTLSSSSDSTPSNFSATQEKMKLATFIQ